MKNQILLVAIAITILGTASCKKEETTVTLKDKLAAKVWKSTGLSENGVNKTAWCWLNSLYEFTQAGTLYYTQGDNMGACSGAVIGEISSSPYKVTADEKYIIIVSSFPSSADTLEVVSITDGVLKTKRVLNKNTPTPDTWEDTFTAQ